ncbi:MAG: flagellin [Halarcobacter sp.]
MELGRIAEIDNAKVNEIEKVKSVKEVDEKSKMVEDEQHRSAKSKSNETQVNEVILDNIKFGYNKSSKDFFVKVTRGDVEYKYPTEDMMKIKAQVLSLLEEQQKESNN